jgi:ABC-type nitrate/sulfonate/bicarbonate transport system permease component
MNLLRVTQRLRAQPAQQAKAIMRKPSSMHNAIGALPLIVLVLVWWLVAKLQIYSSVLLPSPAEVLKVFFTQGDDLLRHTVASFLRVVVGVRLAIVTAIPLGLLIGHSAKIDRLLDWTIQIFRSLPPIALIPLAILFFGIGDRPAIILIWIAAFWPLLINTIFGVKNTEKTLLKVARAARAGDRLILLDVLLPSALPFILTGLRLAVAAGWLTVVVAEMIAVRSGLGYLINYAQTVFRPDLVFAGIIIIGAIGLILDQGLRLLRRRMCRWQEGLVIDT